ncbi:iron complex transport system substrate-binding protein [Elusimicrobium posterum]|uniref:ABC transporter substrate-binding protein n=1 Tax=Elusimicrobium posterum TaxID=3116653 RepID=UPI003C77BFBA
MRNIFTLIICLFIFACGPAEPEQQKQVKDFENQRIVSLVPAVTETLFELGAGDRIIAVSDSCNYPAQAQNLPKEGGMYNPFIERITALEPTIVFSVPNQSVKGRLEEQKIMVVEVPNVKNLEELLENINLIAQKTGKDPKGVREKLKRTFDSSFDSKLPEHAPKVYVEIDENGWTAGGASFIGFLVRSAGGRNIFPGGEYFKTSWEDVVKADPEVIISLNPDSKDFSLRPQGKNLKAVKNKRVFYLEQYETDIVSRPGPRAAEGASILRGYLYN